MNELDPELVTKQTYDRSAADLADYFAGIGPRNKDVDNAFEFAKVPHPRVLELGCGDGRDATYIMRRTDDYIGVDYSRELIKIAKHRLPDVTDQFIVADVRKMPARIPHENNIIFAFASLLHLKPEDMKEVLSDISARLAMAGILYVSLKRSESHQEVIKDDKFGWRLFHYYSADELTAMLPANMHEIYRGTQVIGSTDWFTSAFIKETTNEDDPTSLKH